MTNTFTSEVEATAAQAIAIARAGGSLVRITAQTVREAEKLADIRRLIAEKGRDIPLVADIHFMPKAAEKAAAIVDKVRINPGNYAEKRAKFKDPELSDTDYQQALARTEQNLLPLLKICREQGKALRIGANHGSLSDRIMGRYGDTPEGMVESVVEFTDICRKHRFFDIVISLKASNTRIMVHANRLMAARMQEQGLALPLHLGVTEAGEGEDGRIRSAVGIGTLLADGLGDTVRVSLSEAPEKEIPVARTLINHLQGKPKLKTEAACCFAPFSYKRRESRPLPGISSVDHPVVIGAPDAVKGNDTAAPDFLFAGNTPLPESKSQIVKSKTWQNRPGTYPLFSLSKYVEASHKSSEMNVISMAPAETAAPQFATVIQDSTVVLLVEAGPEIPVNAVRKVFGILQQKQVKTPVILHAAYPEATDEEFLVKASADAGPHFIDGLADGIFLEGPPQLSNARVTATAFSILQASRARFTRTEFISCPSCGRTQFNLQETVAAIRARTGHLKGLKIAIMGCIVNGPGEMADADYGYVGAAPGKITLYKNKEIMKRNIPEEKAVDELIALIKAHGDWHQ